MLVDIKHSLCNVYLCNFTRVMWSIELVF